MATQEKTRPAAKNERRTGLEGEPPGTRRGRGFTPARIVALVLIGLVALNLAYFPLAPDEDEEVSVPAGASAGDLILRSCKYATEDGDSAADCGTLVVRENQADPGSRLIALPVTRIKARSANPAEPIFYLEGGPGITNVEFKQASRYAVNRDVVLVGYRGVDGSDRLECPELTSALKNTSDYLSEKAYSAYADAYRSCADRLTAEGIDVTRYGFVQQVEDFEAARKALGYERINLLSQSAGTRTAMIYAWRYPERINRSVMIGVNPPGNFLWTPTTTDEQIDRYAELCSKDESCSERTDDLAATLRETDIPDRWGLFPIKEDSVRIASLFGLMESTTEASSTAGPVILDAWLSAAEGDAGGFWVATLFGDLMFPDLFVRGQYAAAAHIDAHAASEYFSTYGPEHASNIGYAATAFSWGGGTLEEAWPAAAEEDDYQRMRTSEVETLLIGGELDFSTPPQIATEELLPYLPNGQEVILEGIGHTSSFFAVQQEAGSRLINTYFDSGRVDASLYKPEEIDFTPAQTLAGMAKIVAGVLVGFALLTVLSLVFMARRVRKRGGYGRKASAALRSVYSIVLGLGGWCLGALVALAVMTGVRIDGELFAVLTVGLPVGLGLYLAWVARDWSGATKKAGLAAAAGGALVGVWLGFNATEGPFALLTAIVGATIGGNLALLVLDIVWDRQAHDRFAAKEALLTQPSAS